MGNVFRSFYAQDEGVKHQKGPSKVGGESINSLKNKESSQESGKILIIFYHFPKKALKLKGLSGVVVEG